MICCVLHTQYILSHFYECYQRYGARCISADDMDMGYHENVYLNPPIHAAANDSE